jgi:hypothetical protein
MIKSFLLFSILSFSFAVYAQQNIHGSFSIGHGNSVWRLSKMQIAETNQTGDTVHLYDVDTHGNAPTILGGGVLMYSFNRLSIGLGIGIQHYFINELITDAIYFEESNILAPTTFSSYNNPQPTHFKFYPILQYQILSNNEFKFSSIIQAGSFLTHSLADNSSEGVHWFVTTSLELSYIFNQRLQFAFSPSFDYSRLNSKNNNSTDKPFMNIYSFYNSLGVRYMLDHKK